LSFILHGNFQLYIFCFLKELTLFSCVKFNF